jgi:hypothetical protein
MAICFLNNPCPGLGIHIPVHEKLFWSKTCFFALVEKYLFTLLSQFFFINKKVAQCALLYTPKKYIPLQIQVIVSCEFLIGCIDFWIC